MSGLNGIKASSKEIWNNPSYKKATAAYERLFLLFEGILGFSVPSIILADLLGNLSLLVIGAFRSTLFVSVFRGSLLSGNNRLVFFEDFSDHSYSCLLPSTKSPLIVAISFAILEKSRAILSFVFAGQGQGWFALWLALTPPPFKWLTE